MPEETTEVQAAVSRILRWASRADVRRALAGPTGRELSPTDTWLLGAVVEHGPMRASDLAEWQGVDKSTVTPQLRRLEERDLVVRSPDETDRRAALLTGTERGHRVLEEISAAGAAVFAGVMASWSATDRAKFAALLGRFAEELPDHPV